jgi:hypothetical protein
MRCDLRASWGGAGRARADFVNWKMVGINGRNLVTIFLKFE